MTITISTIQELQNTNFFNIEGGSKPAELRDSITTATQIFPMYQIDGGARQPIQISPTHINGPYLWAEGKLPAAPETNHQPLFMMLVTQIDHVSDDNMDAIKVMLADVAEHAQEASQQGFLTFGMALNAGEVQPPPASLLLKDYKNTLQVYNYVLTPAQNRIEAMLTQIVGRGAGVNLKTNRNVKNVRDMVVFAMEIAREK